MRVVPEIFFNPYKVTFSVIFAPPFKTAFPVIFPPSVTIDFADFAATLEPIL